MSDTFTPEANLPRILMIGAAFLTVTLALILLQPSSETTAGNDTKRDPNAVTRADASILSLTDDDVSLLRDTTAAETVVAEASVASKPAVQDAVQDPIMDEITAGVLANLGSSNQSPATTEVAASAPADDALRNLTSSVLAGLSNNSSRSMEQLVVQALKQGQSDSYIEAMVNAAADAGSIAVPSALRTGEGRVDTDTLLAELVRKSDPNATAPEPIGSNEGVEVRVVQRAGETRHYNFYTVQKGDSLGAIAHRFYGDAALFTVIFEANKRTLSRADKIRAGQRLAIPDQDSST